MPNDLHIPPTDGQPSATAFEHAVSTAVPDATAVDSMAGQNSRQPFVSSTPRQAIARLWSPMRDIKPQAAYVGLTAVGTAGVLMGVSFACMPWSIAPYLFYQAPLWGAAVGQNSVSTWRYLSGKTSYADHVKAQAAQALALCEVRWRAKVWEGLLPAGGKSVVVRLVADHLHHHEATDPQGCAYLEDWWTHKIGAGADSGTTTANETAEGLASLVNRSLAASDLDATVQQLIDASFCRVSGHSKVDAIAGEMRRIAEVLLPYATNSSAAEPLRALEARLGASMHRGQGSSAAPNSKSAKVETEESTYRDYVLARLRLAKAAQQRQACRYTFPTAQLVICTLAAVAGVACALLTVAGVIMLTTAPLIGALIGGGATIAATVAFLWRPLPLTPRETPKPHTLFFARQA